MFLKRKLFLKVVALALVLFCGSFLLEMSATFANSAPPVPPDGSSGIVFKQHDKVQIESEKLNIKLNDDGTADISAKYAMKNTSSEALEVQTMFVSPVEYGDNKDIVVKQDGEELVYTEEFFGLYDYDYDNDVGERIENWEQVLSAIKSPSKPLGEGGGYWEYRISPTSQDEHLQASFSMPDSVSFYHAQGYNWSIIDLTLTNYTWFSEPIEDIVMVSCDDITFDTNGTLTKTPIDDIYQYLYEGATKDAYDEQMRFAEQQFNLYLHNLDTIVKMQSFFSLNYIHKYIGAISYTVSFEPNELVELEVSYVYQMGLSTFRRTAELRYFLSPARYWKSFANIEISLTLSNRYSRLDSSSPEFTKVNSTTYTYVSEVLPEEELAIKVSTGSFISSCKAFFGM